MKSDGSVFADRDAFVLAARQALAAATAVAVGRRLRHVSAVRSLRRSQIHESEARQRFPRYAVQEFPAGINGTFHNPPFELIDLSACKTTT